MLMDHASAFTMQEASAPAQPRKMISLKTAPYGALLVSEMIIHPVECRFIPVIAHWIVTGYIIMITVSDV
jgi:hypothetical protein